jgi:hypothetical protein
MKFIITSGLFFISFFSLSQTGPGGVGTVDGNSELELWLDPDYGISTIGSYIENWEDQSGNGIVFSGNGFQSPFLFESEINGHDCANFLQYWAFERLNISNGIDAIRNGDERTIVYVFRYTADENYLHIMGTRNGNRVIDYGNISRDERLRLRNNNTNAYSSSNSVTRDDWHVGVVQYDGTRSRAWNDGEEIMSTNSSAFSWAIDNRFDIGGGDDPGRSFDGDIAEVIILSDAIDDTRRIIIENYLAAKYGLNLEENDFYRQDRNNRGNFDNEVAGIGRTGFTLPQDNAQGGMVRMLNPTDLDVNEFLFWGHDGGEAAAVEFDDVPSGVEARLERVWRVSEVRTSGAGTNVGNIDIQFDLAGLGPITPTDLTLLIDSDNDGSFTDETPIVGATLVEGDIYQFTGVSDIRNNRRFTIGTSNLSITPLPIELLSFTARVESSDQVRLEWETATELNNDYFTLEYATSDFVWKKFATIDGAGTSNSSLSYTHLHSNPPSGVVYYRLKQTDYDGQFEYFDPVSVNLETASVNTVLIYPNPAVSQITVEGDETELQDLRIFNMLGQDVTHLAVIQIINKQTVRINLERLNAKNYIIRTRTNAEILYK